MFVVPSTAFARKKAHNLLFICLLIFALGGLAACGTDSKLTTGAGGEQDASSQDDSQSAQDSQDSDAQQNDTQDTNDGGIPDAQEQPDATAGSDARDEDDTQNADDTLEETDTGADTGADANSGADTGGDASDAQDSDDTIDPLPDGACNDTQDCQSTGGACLEPGGFLGCGVCNNNFVTCTDDSDCGAGSVSSDQICERVSPEDCACDSSISICKDACTQNSDCDAGESCDPDGHCIETPCSTDDISARACPHNFECVEVVCSVDGDCQVCQRSACDQNSDCANDNVCVNGECYAELGSCQLPPA